MAAAQPSASTYFWKHATVFLASFVPLHSLSILPDAQLVPPPQDTFPDCRMLLHAVTSAASPPADSVAADTTVGATVTELTDVCAVDVTPIPPGRIGVIFSDEISVPSVGSGGGWAGGSNLPGGT